MDFPQHSTRILPLLFLAILFHACSPAKTPDPPATPPPSAATSENQAQSTNPSPETTEEAPKMNTFNNISELFLQLPDEYLLADSDRDKDLPQAVREAILAGNSTPQKLETLNTAGGYLRYSTPTQAGNLITEITYFKNSQGDKLVGVHHYYKGKIEVTTAIYFIERTHNLWIDRTDGVIPRTTPEDFIPPMARDGIFSDLEKIREVVPDFVGKGLSRESFLLYQLPEKGKDLKVQCGRIVDADLKAKLDSGLPDAAEVFVYSWLDGVFTTQAGQVLKRIQEVPHVLFTYATRNEGPQPFIPEDKDSPTNRMRLIDENEAWQERAVIASHPDIMVREGVSHVAWYTPSGYEEGFMGVWVSSVMGYPTTLYFLAPRGDGWADITDEVLSGVTQEAVDVGFANLDQNLVATEGVSLDKLEYDLIPTQNRIHVLYPAEYWEGETAPVLIDLKWKRGKFAPFP